MKKKFTKILSCIFGAALLLTGCATVSGVQNTNKELIYSGGGSAVGVSSYTYFANAYTPYDSSDTGEFDFAGNAKVSYLSRINNDTVTFTNGKDFSPDNVEAVQKSKKQRKVTGFQNQDMFVLGNYIYFTSTNTHQNDDLENDFSLVTLWRSKLDGDDLKELYTTEYFSSDAFFAPVGDVNDGYYWICYTGKYTTSSKFSGQVISISLGNKCGKPKVIADKVDSAIFADVNNVGSSKRVFYTTTEKNGDESESCIYSVDYSKSAEPAKYNANGKTATFKSMIRDKVVYEANGITYMRDVSDILPKDSFDSEAKNKKFSDTSVSDLRLIDDDGELGYIYKAEGGSLMYVADGQNTTNAKVLATSSDYNDILFVDGNRVYLSTDSTILRVSTKPDPGKDKASIEVLVNMNSDSGAAIQSGQYGFDGQYVYFFATLDSSVETEETFDEADTNYYMYRVKKNDVISKEGDSGNYQLVGKTINTRTPKIEEEE